MHKTIIHFGAGNIGRGLVGQIAQENGVSLVFVDVVTQVIKQLNQLNQYTICCWPSNTKIIIRHCYGLHLVYDQAKVIATIAQATMLTTAVGINNLPSLINYITAALKQRKSKEKLIIAAFENGFKTSEWLYKQIINQNAFYQTKLTFVNMVIDRLIPAQNNALIDVNVEDFYCVWYQKQNPITNWLLAYTTNEITGCYQSCFAKKFYGLNGLHFGIAMIGFKHQHQYIHQTINDPNCSWIINNFIFEASVAIANITKNDLNQIQKYLQNNLQRFANPYLQDTIKRIARNAKQKISPKERILPLYNWLKQNHYPHQAFAFVYNTAQEYVRLKEGLS